MDYDFPFSWECHHPNWLSLHHFSEGLVETTNQKCFILNFHGRQHSRITFRFSPWLHIPCWLIDSELFDLDFTMEFSRLPAALRCADVSLLQASSSGPVRTQRSVKSRWTARVQPGSLSTGWWFQTWLLFSIIYGMSSFPLTFRFFKMKMVETTNQ